MPVWDRRRWVLARLGCLTSHRATTYSSLCMPDTGPMRRAAPTLEHVRRRLSSLMREICALDSSEIRDSATIDRDFEMESVQMVELQVAIEQEFDVTIDFLEVLRLNGFRRITEYIHGLASSARD